MSGPQTTSAPTPIAARAWAILAAILVCGCQAAAVQPRSSSPAGADGTGSPSPTPPPATGSTPGISIPDAGPAATAPAPPAQACAAEVHTAQKLPLDLLLLVDASGSMDEMSGTQSKWDKIRTALAAFVGDPASAGLGVGVAFFPSLSPADVHACAQDGDCAGFSDPMVAHPCRVEGACYAAGVPLLTDRICGPNAQANIFNCPGGMTCLRRGKCASSGAVCVDAAGTCSGGAADHCQIDPGICATSNEGCNVAKPGQLDVAVADLPGQGAAVVAALAARHPDGSTPMASAADSALAALIARQQSQPQRRAALVLATDGLPNGCGGGENPTAVAARLAQARAAAPAIPTYVVGVFAPDEITLAQPALAQFATAGGTKAPFILATGDDLNQRLLDALKEIRGLAVACEYNIPAPQMGQIDFGKVNVNVNTSATDLSYVGSADHCQADKGGWYYDVTPSGTTQPRSLLICPASCARLQADSAARVDLVFGCATRTID